MSIDVSIVIPVYNAGSVLADAVDRLVTVLTKSGTSFEILICDDASTDDSPAVLNALPERYPQVRGWANPENRGLGATLRRLFLEVRGTRIIYCDCDLPFGEQIVSVLLRELQDYDIVVASRYKEISNDIPWLRRLCSRAYYCLCKLLFNVPVVDIGSGSVGIHKSALEKLNLGASGFDVHIELYVKAMRAGLSIKEIPAQIQKHALGSFRIFKHGPRVMWDTLRLWRERKDG